MISMVQLFSLSKSKNSSDASDAKCKSKLAHIVWIHTLVAAAVVVDAENAKSSKTGITAPYTFPRVHFETSRING